jgi:hypothetical protein
MATVDGEDDLDGDGWAGAEDCDDARSDVHPGAVEVPYDGVDQDCDGFDLVDRDGDGHAGLPAGGDDCADGDAGVHPDAVEVCGDLRDQDCDGAVDDACDTAIGPPDPGGFAWVCGVAGAGHVVSGWLLIALVLAVRRRA